MHVGVVGFAADPLELPEEPEPVEEPELELEPVDGLETVLDPDDVELPVLGFDVLPELEEPELELEPVEGLDALLDPELFVDELDFVALEDFESEEEVSFFVSDAVSAFSDSATSFLSSVTLTW